MTKKSDFSSQEWQLVKDGPEWVFAALAAADGNVAITIKAKESKTFKGVIDDYRSRSELMAEVLEDSSKVSKDVKKATLSEAEDAIGQINDILDKKATDAEAAEYRKFLLFIAESVAEATGEGALGLGEKFSDKEKRAMAKIKDALKTRQKSVKTKEKVAKKPAAKPAAKKTVEAKKPAASKPVRKASEASTVTGRPNPKKIADIEKHPKVIAVHTVKKNETWTHLTLKYYGHTSEPYWRYLYEFNKELIGDNYKDFYEGLKIEIPELPDHLKDEE